MKKIYISFLLIVLSQSINAQGLTLKYDSSKGDFEKSKQVCNQRTNMTVSTADYLSQALQVSSKAITFESASVSPTTGFCCLKLDTPKGIIKTSVWLIFENSIGQLVGHSNTVNQKEDSPMCF